MKNCKFKTLDDAKKVIIDCDLKLEMERAVTNSKINQWFRIFRSIILWIGIFSISYSYIMHRNLITSLKIFAAFIIIRAFLKLVVDWSWFNEDKEFRQIKLNTINYILNNCEEWLEPERKPEEWEYKQIYKNMLGLMNLKIDDNKQ